MEGLVQLAGAPGATAPPWPAGPEAEQPTGTTDTAAGTRTQPAIIPGPMVRVDAEGDPFPVPRFRWTMTESKAVSFARPSVRQEKPRPGGRHVDPTRAETWLRDPAGNDPARPRQDRQPEASLAWSSRSTRVTVTTKRRQRARGPRNRTPKCASRGGRRDRRLGRQHRRSNA